MCEHATVLNSVIGNRYYVRRGEYVGEKRGGEREGVDASFPTPKEFVIEGAPQSGEKGLRF